MRPEGTSPSAFASLQPLKTQNCYSSELGVGVISKPLQALERGYFESQNSSFAIFSFKLSVLNILVTRIICGGSVYNKSRGRRILIKHSVSSGVGTSKFKIKLDGLLISGSVRVT